MEILFVKVLHPLKKIRLQFSATQLKKRTVSIPHWHFSKRIQCLQYHSYQLCAFLFVFQLLVMNASIFHWTHKNTMHLNFPVLIYSVCETLKLWI